ncbi:MAG: glycosyltransferase family 4 protein [Gemmatimonadota bacterium]|nr:glycosyltransferase family 4 protein [Gemmatimonadota bacterium]MDP6529273.1 glycosyltransferase family 4 protein [Gemmatimonadota bacterium]
MSRLSHWPMHILLVNQHYPPESGATGVLAEALAAELVARGHSVTVVAGHSGGVPGSVDCDGVRVLRHRVPERGAGGIRRLAHYAAFAARLAILRNPGRVDVVLAFSSTPVLGGIGAVLLARRLGAPLVYGVQDLHPEGALAMGVLRDGAATAMATRLDGIAWRAAARIVLVGECLRVGAAPRGIARRAPVVIPNWADTTRVVPADPGPHRRRLGIDSEAFLVGYSGNVGRAQDFDTILAAARILGREGGPRSIRFLITGDGVRAEEIRREADALPNVMIIPPVSGTQLCESLAAVSLSLVPLRAGLGSCCVPSKVYSALASGRPVAGILEGGNDAARMIHEADCGFCVPPGDSISLAARIRELATQPDRADEMGRNARSYAEANGGLDRAACRYEAVLRRAIL